MPAIHFVLCRFKSGSSWIERDINDTDLETTIRDIVSGELEDVEKVLAVFAEESFARDVTSDIAEEIAHRHASEPVTPRLHDFIEQHTSIRLANELTVEAA